MPANRTAKVEQQHLRLLDGLATAIREKGLARTQVSDIVGHAHASRRTFYKHFPDKDSCLVELVHRSAATIIEAVAAATDLHAPGTIQIEQAVDAYISILSGDPALTLALASPSVGERIVRAQRHALERFAEYLVVLTASASEGRTPLAPVSVECAYMLASGLRAAALRAIERGDGLDRVGEEGKAVFKRVLISGAAQNQRRRPHPAGPPSRD
ncbi:TetR family transcriptional regulator [Mycolicibacterium moriokaense]|uniref:TetR family transcriptional regulator n=2 Tax=Mycolicibacterium moriokaense TaxID=39691 RepID=A0A318HGB4_9MYCO|nr:TetR family transcriptional regulator [Mycolicibacterium moriokaense]